MFVAAAAALFPQAPLGSGNRASFRPCTRATHLVRSIPRLARPAAVRAVAATVDVEAARKLLDGQCTVLDIRAAGEYEESHITKPPRKSLNMPFAVGQEDGAAFVAQVSRRFPNRATNIIVMCGDGVQGSAEAAALLEAAGYSGVAQMEGGYVGYTQVWSPSGKRRPPAGRWVSTGKEALKSGLDLRDVAMAYEEGGNMKVARYAEGLPPGESL